MSIQLSDNKIVAAPGASTTADIAFNAALSTSWFPNHTVQSSSGSVELDYDWPDGAGNVPATLSDSQQVTTASPVTITAEIDSSNGITVTKTAQLSVQPPGDPGQSCHNETCGSPINLATGNVWIQEKDYSLPGLGGGLQLTRTWNSLWQNLAPPAVAGIFGHSWQSNFEERLFFPDPNSVTYYRNDGSSWVFAQQGAVASQNLVLVSPNAQINASLFYSAGQYSLTLPDGTKRIFNQGGQLQTIVDRNGNLTTLGYDTSGRMSTVTDPAGRSITFTYGDPNNTSQVTSVRDAVGVIANYAYDSSSRLVNVIYADGSSLNFAYGANSMVTSVTDGHGKVLETHTYDSADRGVSSSRALGADSVTTDFSTPGTTLLTDSLGNNTTYGLQYTGGQMSITSVAGPGCASCGSRGASSTSFYFNALPSSTTDALGNLTCYIYDGAGNVQELTLASPGSSCPSNEVGSLLPGPVFNRSLEQDFALDFGMDFETNGQDDDPVENEPKLLLVSQKSVIQPSTTCSGGKGTQICAFGAAPAANSATASSGPKTVPRVAPSITPKASANKA